MNFRKIQDGGSNIAEIKQKNIEKEETVLVLLVFIQSFFSANAYFILFLLNISSYNFTLEINNNFLSFLLLFYTFMSAMLDSSFWISKIWQQIYQNSNKTWKSSVYYEYWHRLFFYFHIFCFMSAVLDLPSWIFLKFTWLSIAYACYYIYVQGGFSISSTILEWWVAHLGKNASYICTFPSIYYHKSKFLSLFYTSHIKCIWIEL